MTRLVADPVASKLLALKDTSSYMYSHQPTKRGAIPRSHAAIGRIDDHAEWPLFIIQPISSRGLCLY